MNSFLKYTSKDTEKLVEVFASILDKKDNSIELYNEMLKLVDYPVHVLQEFLKCMEIFNDKDENYLKENYSGVIGYITLRLNFV